MNVRHKKSGIVVWLDPGLSVSERARTMVTAFGCDVLYDDVESVDFGDNEKPDSDTVLRVQSGWCYPAPEVMWDTITELTEKVAAGTDVMVNATLQIRGLRDKIESLEFERAQVKLSMVAISLETKALSEVSDRLNLSKQNWLDSAAGSILDCCFMIDKQTDEVLATLGDAPGERFEHKAFEDSE